jgi:chromosome segregation ATPase
LQEKYSSAPENNWQNLLITNLGMFLIRQSQANSKKFHQEKAKLQQLINDAQQAQQQAENERDTARRELDTALNAQKAAEKEINEQKPKLIQKENELNKANQKINDYRTQLANKEQQTSQQLNQSLDLGLNNPSLEQVIERIQELINKPPLTFYQEFSDSELEEQLKSSQQTISQLEKQLKEQTPFGEDLNVIKELELQSLEELFGKGNNL